MTHEERLKIFEEVECGCVTDAMIAFGIGGWMSGIFPVNKDAKIYGRARTAYFDIVTAPRQPLTPYELIEACEPGDVLVWNADMDGNIMGENIYTFVKNHQVNGVVIEGKVRDVNQIVELGGKVACRGAAVGSVPVNFRATKETIQIPVTVGGVVVNPGDYICGDADGIMVVPAADVDDVLIQAQMLMGWEDKLAAAIAAGYTSEQMKAVYAEKPLMDRAK